MARAQRRDVGDNASSSRGKYPADKLDPARVARNLLLFSPTEAVLSDLMAKARESIPGLAHTEDVLRVLRHNSDCVMAVARRSRFDPSNPAGEGFIAMLPLNRIGLELLALDALNPINPNIKFIARPGEQAEAIYWWAIYAPGPLAASMALFMERISAGPYAGLDIYARPATAEGRRFLEVLGFREGADIVQTHAPHIWKFSRTPQAPLYDSYVPGANRNRISITVARNFEDLNRVVAIRSAVYIGEQECPYEEEYDGNDLTAATHLIAYAGDEPAGCLRVRFFADFAKLERLAIRKEFRNSRAAFQLVRAGLALCRAKGYRRAYGHSQIRLVDFWARFGFRTFEGGKSFVFSDFDYVEMLVDLEPASDAVTIGADPYVIIRPEGRWHKPGILEKSASRPAARPSVTPRKRGENETENPEVA